MIRSVVHDALAGARDLVGEVVQDLRDNAELTDDEVLHRYVTHHQGRPWAMLDFAKAAGSTVSTDGGTDKRMGRGMVDGRVLEEAMRYEEEMERLLKRRK